VKITKNYFSSLCLPVLLVIAWAVIWVIGAASFDQHKAREKYEKIREVTREFSEISFLPIIHQFIIIIRDTIQSNIESTKTIEFSNSKKMSCLFLFLINKANDIIRNVIVKSSRTIKSKFIFIFLFQKTREMFRSITSGAVIP